MFPKVTTSKKVFIRHIVKICKAYNIEDEMKKEWVKKVSGCACADAHYFPNMIYLHHLSPYLILHEFLHHVILKLRVLTLLKFWFIADDLIDTIDIIIFRKGQKGKLYLYYKE